MTALTSSQSHDPKRKGVRSLKRSIEVLGVPKAIELSTTHVVSLRDMLTTQDEFVESF